MDVLLALLFVALIGLPFALLDGAALRWGVDSREAMPDDHRRWTDAGAPWP